VSVQGAGVTGAVFGAFGVTAAFDSANSPHPLS
jgi:hypothetical protein